MDQKQQRALNALEPYILLSKSANSPRTAADLVTQATSNPNTFVFSELLQTPNIQALQQAAPEYASFYTLLEIFAWGTWQDYTSTENLPRLIPAQELKLRQLSLLTLANSPSNLSYIHLLSSLDLPNARALEDVVISTIYAGLITAKFDTLSQRVEISSVAPLRDLRPGSVPGMIAVLEDWDWRCVDVLKDIERQIKDVRRAAGERKRREDAHAKAVEGRMNEGEKRAKRAGDQGDGDEMILDGDGRKTRSAKRAGGNISRIMGERSGN